MKRYCLFLITLITLYAYGQQPSTQKRETSYESILRIQKEAIGKTLPAFTVDYDGKTFNNENLKGKTVFINLWFAACPPCIAEFDALNELYDSIKNRTNFEFISFTYELPETIKELAEKYKIKYKIFSIKHEDCYRLNQNAGFPTSIIVDPNGIIKFLRAGGPTDSEKARSIIFNEYYPVLLNGL